jgi:hypothetical protein
MVRKRKPREVLLVYLSSLGEGGRICKNEGGFQLYTHSSLRIRTIHYSPVAFISSDLYILSKWIKVFRSADPYGDAKKK